MLEPAVDFYCASIKRATKRMGTNEVILSPKAEFYVTRWRYEVVAVPPDGRRTCMLRILKQGVDGFRFAMNLLCLDGISPYWALTIS